MKFSIKVEGVNVYVLWYLDKLTFRVASGQTKGAANNEMHNFASHLALLLDTELAPFRPLMLGGTEYRRPSNYTHPSGAFRFYPTI